MKIRNMLVVFFLMTVAILYSQTLMYSNTDNRINMRYDLNSEFMHPHNWPSNIASHRLDSLVAISLSGSERKSVFTYDRKNLILVQQNFLEGDTWKLDDRVLLTYNDQGQTAEIKMQSLREDSVWNDLQKQTYEYNEENNLTLYLMQSFINGSWNNSGRILFSYPNGDREEIIQYFNLGEWIDRTRIYTFIGDNGNQDSAFVCEWGDTTWNDHLRWYRYYDEFNRWNYVISQQWLDSSWTFQYSVEGIYDGDGKITKMNYYDWSNQFEELKSRLEYSYDTEGNLIEVFNEFKTADGWFPAQIDPIVIKVTENYSEGYLYNKVKLYYSPLSSVNEDEVYTDFTLHQNYPNPFNPSTTIKFTIPNVGDAYHASRNTKLVVYDILGREIKTVLNKPMQPGSYEIEFDGSDLSSGVYFYVLETGGKRLSKKMLLVK